MVPSGLSSCVRPVKSLLQAKLAVPLNRTLQPWSGLCLHDLTAAEAGGADANALSLAADLGVHGTQVDVPAPFSNVVRVADAVARLRLLAADITLLCHDRS